MEVGLKKLEEPEFTASARAGVASLVVVSEISFLKLTGFPSRPSSIASPC
jgi:hypothetical protein